MSRIRARAQRQPPSHRRAPAAQNLEEIWSLRGRIRPTFRPPPSDLGRPHFSELFGLLQRPPGVGSKTRAFRRRICYAVLLGRGVGGGSAPGGSVGSKSGYRSGATRGPESEYRTLPVSIPAGSEVVRRLPNTVVQRFLQSCSGSPGSAPFLWPILANVPSTLADCGQCLVNVDPDVTSTARVRPNLVSVGPTMLQVANFGPNVGSRSNLCAACGQLQGLPGRVAGNCPVARASVSLPSSASPGPRASQVLRERGAQAEGFPVSPRAQTGTQGSPSLHERTRGSEL